MDDGERKSRLALAEALRESADHSSEQALRDALSRSYYSVFHAGCTLLGRGYKSHKEFLRDLADSSKVNTKLAADVRSVYMLRIRADYVFDAIARFYADSLEEFRQRAVEGLRLGQEVYRELDRIQKEVQDGASN